LSYLAALESAQQVFASLTPLAPVVAEMAAAIQHALRNGGKILLCGNGGSGCEAQHLAAELVGHYKTDRAALPAMALSADGALLTCLGNDFAFEDIFARQVEAFGQPGDALLVFTTSGNSPNVLRALAAARRRGVKTMALLGRDGGAARGQADIELIVPHGETARIQEAHQFLLHAIMDVIESVELRPCVGS
jgi:D-sedoheptulose 7-phosphate isomerase